jgi:hypothetical protein
MGRGFQNFLKKTSLFETIILQIGGSTGGRPLFEINYF